MADFKDMPRVSVLINTFNRPHIISRAIKSVLDQDFSDWEIIAVDNGSQDNKAEEYVKKFANEKIKYFWLDKKTTIAIASNFGLDQCRGEYIAILDDDDCWAVPDKLSAQVKFLDENLLHVGCGGGFILTDQNNKEHGRILKPELHEDIIRNALMANPMVNSTTLFRKSVALEIGKYDETLLQFADWDFWLKMGLAGKLYNFPEYFLYYQMWESGSSFAKQRENALSALRIVKKYKNKYPRHFFAIGGALAYAVHALLPGWFKRRTSPFFSHLKKRLFQNRLSRP